MVTGLSFPSCSPSAAASLAVKPPVCHAEHGTGRPKASRTEAKKKAVKPLATNRSIRRTAQPALAEGPLKVHRPMLAAERYLRAMRRQTKPPRRAPFPLLPPYLWGAVLKPCGPAAQHVEIPVRARALRTCGTGAKQIISYPAFMACACERTRNMMAVLALCTKNARGKR